MPNNKNDKTLNTPQSTRPFADRLPPKNPGFSNFKKPGFSGPKFTQSFRTQNRGGGGK